MRYLSPARLDAGVVLFDRLVQQLKERAVASWRLSRLAFAVGVSHEQSQPCRVRPWVLAHELGYCSLVFDEPRPPALEEMQAGRVCARHRLPRVEPRAYRRRIDLTHVDLSGSDLSGANLTEANFSYSTLRGADLSHSMLVSALFLVGLAANLAVLFLAPRCGLSGG